MTRVDFYILQDVDASAMHRFACRLICKAAVSGNQVYVHARDKRDAQDMDDLLWAYPDQRFIPHGQQQDDAARSAAVVVGWDDPQDHDGLLVNLSDEIPNFFGRFDRVAEIVVQGMRDRGRKRYKFYRDRGYPLFHHDLDDWEMQ